MWLETNEVTKMKSSYTYLPTVVTWSLRWNCGLLCRKDVEQCQVYVSTNAQASLQFSLDLAVTFTLKWNPFCSDIWDWSKATKKNTMPANPGHSEGNRKQVNSTLLLSNPGPTGSGLSPPLLSPSGTLFAPILSVILCLCIVNKSSPKWLLRFCLSVSQFFFDHKSQDIEQ